MILAVANNKGGVGKTTTAETMGVILSQNKGKKVLLIDMDAQTNLTNNLMRKKPDFTVMDFLFKKREENNKTPFYEVRENLFLLAGSDTVSVLCGVLTRQKEEGFLKDKLKPISKDFDFVIIDCAPGLNMLTQNAFEASEGVLIPTTPEGRTLEGLISMLNFLDTVREKTNPELTNFGVLITRYNRRKINKTVVEMLRTYYPDLIFETLIRENIAITEAPVNGCTLLEYDAEANGAKDYISFVDEFLNKINS